MRFAVNLGWLLWVPAAGALAAPSCEILDYGIMGPGQRTAQVLQRTLTIPARLGVRFGIVHEIRDVPADGRLEAQIHHPPMTAPGKAAVTLSGGRMNPASAGSAYSLDEPHEVLPGPWRFEVRYQDKVLCEKTFNVVAQAAQQERYDNPVDGRTYTAPGGWNEYRPGTGTKVDAPQGKVRTQHVRLLNAQSDYEGNVSVPAMAELIKRVEREAGAAFANAPKGSVLVQINCAPGSQTVKLGSQGNIDRALMQAFYDRLVKLERLPVKDKEVAFQVLITIAE